MQLNKLIISLFLWIVFVPEKSVIDQTNKTALSKNVSKVWVADMGNGTYKNPILYADYFDPDVIGVGDDYYMTASSFNCMPAYPFFISMYPE